MQQFLHKRDTLVELFCVIDDLVKKLSPHLLPKKSSAGRKPKLVTSELITIGVIFLFCDSNSFKGFYHLMKFNNMFPNMPEYSRLLRNVKSATSITLIILKILIQMNKVADNEGNKFIDSAPLPVCRNKRIFNYKVSDKAGRGKSSMGWFYGFKLHVIVDEHGKLLSFDITPGNTSDKNHAVVLNLMKGLKGILVGDSGYVSNPLKEKLAKNGVNLIFAPSKPMKKLMSKADHGLLKLRQIVETVIGNVKYRTSCVSSLPRSFSGYLWRYVTAIFVYILLNQYI